MSHEALRIPFDQLNLAVRYLCFLKRWNQWSYWYHARPDHRRYYSPEPAEFPRTSVEVIRKFLGDESYEHIQTWLSDDCARTTLHTLELLFQGAPKVNEKAMWDIGTLMHWWQEEAYHKRNYPAGSSIRSAIRTYFQAFAAGNITEQTLQSPIEKVVLMS